MSTQLTPQRIPVSFFDPQPDTTMAWLGMAGLLINARGTILLVDPLITVVSRRGRACSETDLPLLVPFLPIEASSGRSHCSITGLSLQTDPISPPGVSQTVHCLAARRRARDRFRDERSRGLWAGRY